MATRTVTIASKVGLHARPAAIFAAAAGETDEDVTITFDGEEADAASVLEVMGLGAMHGDEVILESDNEEILDKLVELLESDLDA